MACRTGRSWVGSASSWHEMRVGSADIVRPLSALFVAFNPNERIG
jgi:hypothetical protein